MDHIILLAVSVSFFCGGVVKGVVGMGLPLTALASMTTVLDLRTAVSLVVIPIILTNILQAFRGGMFKELLRKFWLMLLIAAAGVFVGVYCLYRFDPSYFLITLGIIVCAYSLNNLYSVRLSISEQSMPIMSPIVGACSGLAAGMTGTIGVPIAIYFQALGLKKDMFVQAVGIQFLFTGSILTLALFRQGGFTSEISIISAIAVIPSLIGMFAGKIIREKVSEDRFRTWLYVVLLFVGLNLIRKGIF